MALPLKAIGVCLCMGGFGIGLSLAGWDILMFTLTIVFQCLWAWTRPLGAASFPTEKSAAPAANYGFWFYNVTNLEAIKTGDVPAVLQQGPYVYDLYITFGDVALSEDLTDVSFSRHYQWVLNSELSAGSETDMVSAPNPSFVNLTSHHQFSEAAALASLCSDSDCQRNAIQNGSTFASRSVHTWLWDFEDPILAATSGDGKWGNLMGCAGDWDMDAQPHRCNASDPSGAVYTGVDSVSKWYGAKDVADDIDGISTSLLPDASNLGPDGYIYPATEPYVTYNADFGRLFHMEVLEDDSLFVLPVKRFVISEDDLKVDSSLNTYEAGLFNITGSGPFVIKSPGSCGWQSGKHKEQVSAFVVGHVTGYPACAFSEDAYHLDIDAYMGVGWQSATQMELNVVLTDEADGQYQGKPQGPMSGLGQYVGESGKYALIPYVRHGVMTGPASEGLALFIWDFTYYVNAYVRWSHTALMVFYITGFVVSCVGVVLIVIGK